MRVQRWCGICFAWREQIKGRCKSCGNAHMRGEALPILAQTHTQLPGDGGAERSRTAADGGTR